MTLTEAMQYRGLTAWKLAERTGVKTQTAKKWTEPGGTRKITVERLRQITEILDDPEARRKAEQVFGRLCWKDAWEELREVRAR